MWNCSTQLMQSQISLKQPGTPTLAAAHPYRFPLHPPMCTCTPSPKKQRHLGQFHLPHICFWKESGDRQTQNGYGRTGHSCLLYTYMAAHQICRAVPPGHDNSRTWATAPLKVSGSTPVKKHCGRARRALASCNVPRYDSCTSARCKKRSPACILFPHTWLRHFLDTLSEQCVPLPLV